MYNDISVQLISLIYVVVLSFVYFLKRKYNFLESRVYKILLIFTMIVLIFDIVSMFIIEEVIYMEMIARVVTKVYFSSLLLWIMLFIFYVFLNIPHLFKEKFTGSNPVISSN